MISRETANTLLEEFSRQQEIEPLQLDDANYWRPGFGRRPCGASAF